MQQKRIKTGLALVQPVLDLCDKNLTLAGVRSRNDFVEKAIEFYSGYLNAETNSRFYEEMYSKSGEVAVQKVGDMLIKSYFRLTVEVAKLTHLIAASNNLSPETLDKLTKTCVDECKHIAGFWSTEDIINFQRRNR